MSKIRIAYIDDREEERFLFKKKFGNTFDVHMFESIYKFVAEEQDYDTVYCDLMLSESVGIETVKNLCSIIDEAPLIIVLTGMNKSYLTREKLRQYKENTGYNNITMISKGDFYG